MSKKKSILTPDELYKELYKDVQLNHIFPDTKTFVDCEPKIPSNQILDLYKKEKNSENFNLHQFVNKYFKMPYSPASNISFDHQLSIVDYIDHLWDLLIQKDDNHNEESSLVSLPYPYIVPGGRFREIFYWDSYFTMLGLSLSSKRISLIKNMIDNFSYLIDTYGFIPNGNRTYFLSRSQPPFFACMIQLLADLDDHPAYIRRQYLFQLHKEYQFWMMGKDQLSETNIVNRHVVRLSDGKIVNRYWDSLTTPRPESYPKEEIECKQAQQKLGITSEEFYSHNRAACESGWDFSSRWFKDGKSKETNLAGNILPVDLNCLLYFIENYLSIIYREQETDNDLQLSEQFQQLAESRKKTIQNLFWNDETQFFMDYNFINNQHTSILSLAAVYPLFFNIATKKQAEYVHQRLREDFLKDNGLVTTLQQTGQQWDYPNGWPQLQFLAYQGLLNYGFDQLANEIRSRWLNLNDRIYNETGLINEKYNVVDHQNTGGGNYSLQYGFGWTNGIYLKFRFS